MERRKKKGADVGWEAASGAQSSKDEVWSPGEPGDAVERMGSLGDQSSMSSAGCSQKKRKAAVRKESAETQEYESCQQNGTEVDRDEGMEELSFVPSAVSDTAGWHERDKKCTKEGLKFSDTTPILVEDERRPHAINFCMECYNLRDPFQSMIGEHSSRGKLSACLVHKDSKKGMWKRFAAKKLRARGLIVEAATATQLEKSWPGRIAVQRGA